jgi:hypothetical protein
MSTYGNDANEDEGEGEDEVGKLASQSGAASTSTSDSRDARDSARHRFAHLDAR